MLPGGVTTRLCYRWRSVRQPWIRQPQPPPPEAPLPRGLFQLTKATAFTIGCCGASFLGAAVWQYERMRHEARAIISQHWTWEPKRGSLRQQVPSHVIIRVLLPVLTAASTEIAQPHLSCHANNDDAAFGHPMDSCITPKSPALLLNPAAHLNCTPSPLAASLDARLEYRLPPTSTQQAIKEQARPETLCGPGCCASTQQANLLMLAMPVPPHIIFCILFSALTAASTEMAQPYLSWHANDDDAAFGHPMNSCITPKSPALLLNPVAHLNCTPSPLAASFDARLEYRLPLTSTRQAIKEQARPETLCGPGCCASTQQTNPLMFAMQLNTWWHSIPEGDRVAYGLIAANAVVFLLWRVPRMEPVMLRYFVSHPTSKPLCLPMFLSTFSHHSFFHLAANMVVLNSFAPTAVALLGREQFLAMYISGGVVSSLASYLNKVATRRAAMSLGASGAILAVIGALCVQYPDAQLSIICLPFFTFSAAAGLRALWPGDMEAQGAHSQHVAPAA
ncbi:rhomboid family intramembrane serine protease rho-7 isoform X2 [Rhipicephalus microplus]|uniref:rhomboid family intramembrane serine protease rho-7 isoform X2 n=1 Tax=Rhipicephalus microplus TaxID=6941 RepID=UPI003F6CEA72